MKQFFIIITFAVFVNSFLSAVGPSTEDSLKNFERQLKVVKCEGINPRFKGTRVDGSQIEVYSILAYDYVWKMDVIKIRIDDKEFDLHVDTSKDARIFAVSPDGSKLVIYYNSLSEKGHYLKVYSIENDHVKEMSDFLDMREIVQCPLGEYLHIPERIAVSNDGIKVAFIESLKMKATPRRGYFVIVFDWIEKKKQENFIIRVPQNLQERCVTFFTLLLNENSTHVGTYYKESQFFTLNCGINADGETNWRCFENFNEQLFIAEV